MTHLPPDDFEALAFAQQAEVEIDGDTAHMTTAAGTYTTSLPPRTAEVMREVALDYYLRGDR